MDIFSPSGIILRALINKKSKNRIPFFSISFFSKVVQWYIEHYSTEAALCVRAEFVPSLTIFINCYLGKSAKFPSNQGISGCFI